MPTSLLRPAIHALRLIFHTHTHSLFLSQRRRRCSQPNCRLTRPRRPGQGPSRVRSPVVPGAGATDLADWVPGMPSGQNTLFSPELTKAKTTDAGSRGDREARRARSQKPHSVVVVSIIDISIMDVSHHPRHPRAQWLDQEAYQILSRPPVGRYPSRGILRSSATMRPGSRPNPHRIHPYGSTVLSPPHQPTSTTTTTAHPLQDRGCAETAMRPYDYLSRPANLLDGNPVALYRSCETPDPCAKYRNTGF